MTIKQGASRPRSRKEARSGLSVIDGNSAAGTAPERRDWLPRRRAFDLYCGVSVRKRGREAGFGQERQGRKSLVVFPSLLCVEQRM
ncbi:hypothetical protein LY78DRAFT_187517 [Colletotrichum sublineola]|nr:hypothetical protein LY78DRAFT_187517 [Colletotrichum sublineola]